MEDELPNPVTQQTTRVAHRGTENRVLLSRFLVREGGNGWFVYDRERKGAALVGISLAERLTKEQAEQIQKTLSANSEKSSGNGSVD